MKRMKNEQERSDQLQNEPLLKKDEDSTEERKFCCCVRLYNAEARSLSLICRHNCMLADNGEVEAFLLSSVISGKGDYTMLRKRLNACPGILADSCFLVEGNSPEKYIIMNSVGRGDAISLQMEEILLNSFAEDRTKNEIPVSGQKIDHVDTGDKESRKKLLITTKQGLFVLPLDEIVYCSAASNYCEIFMLDSTVHKISVTLSILESRLEGLGFFRPNKSLLINTHNLVQCVNENNQINVVMKNSDTIRLSNVKKKELVSAMQKIAMNVRA